MSKVLTRARATKSAKKTRRLAAVKQANLDCHGKPITKGCTIIENDHPDRVVGIVVAVHGQALLYRYADGKYTDIDTQFVYCRDCTLIKPAGEFDEPYCRSWDDPDVVRCEQQVALIRFLRMCRLSEACGPAQQIMVAMTKAVQDVGAALENLPMILSKDATFDEVAARNAKAALFRAEEIMWEITGGVGIGDKAFSYDGLKAYVGEKVANSFMLVVPRGWNVKPYEYPDDENEKDKAA